MQAALEAGRQLEAAAEKQSALEQAVESSRDLQDKFELALSDVQQHRQRVAELEQELASRPELGADESAELAQLRAERTELRDRLADVEARVEAAGVGEDSQEVEDLRRRFELAVEDVRQLKTENADLQQQLAAGGAAEPVDDAGLDWEAQKRRMLASLEGETAPAQAEERATIEGTIRITDEVVAEKDAEIAQLRARLEQGPGGGVPAVELESPDEDESPVSPLSDDERLETERQRLATLEGEWEEKLRAAELELSVERAKIAREQAELAELRIEVEAQRKANTATSGGGEEEGKPAGRNWFNKLGLGSGEE